MFAVLTRRQPRLFMVTMGAGALAWVIGDGLWLGGAAIFRIVGWWVAFLALTIAGERLELNRVLRPTVTVRAAFVAAIGVVIAGVAMSARWPEAGTRVMGAGLFGLAMWLVRYDVARRTVHQPGLTRYMAVGLLAGYGWLGAGGLLQIFTDAAVPGLMYDAALHAILLGFVMSMVFAHAPVIFPAVLRRPLVFRPRFYLHLGLLHASVLARIAGDLVDALGPWRVWGGLLNALALAAFVANVTASVRAGGQDR
jgi:hypothetical protein